MDETIKKIEDDNNVNIIYMTLYGSKLYGTDNPNSDKDYKFLYIPNLRDVTLKQDLEHIKIGKSTDTKNTKDDVDLDGLSIYKFFNLLKKGETGALDILFSMFREDTITFEKKEYTDILRENYSKFINRKLNSFVGYAIGQSKKFNIKGNRFKELVDFKKEIHSFDDETKNNKLDDGEGSWDKFRKLFEEKNYKYIKMVMAPGPKTMHSKEDIEYIEVLGSKYRHSVTVKEFILRIDMMEEQFGNRTRASAKSDQVVDFKGLSHAVRVLLEVDEVLDTGFITFPLPQKEYVKQVKSGSLLLEDVMDFLDKKLDVVNIKMEETHLPLKSDTGFIESLILDWVK